MPAPAEDPLMPAAYRYTLAPAVPPDEAEATLALAVLAAEALHGEARTRLDAGHAFDAAARAVEIAAGTAAGRDLNRLFLGFVTREFGPAGVRVEPLPRPAEPVPA